MNSSDKQTDEHNGDEALRRMLRTAPEPNKDKPEAEDKKENGAAAKPPRQRHISIERIAATPKRILATSI